MTISYSVLSIKISYHLHNKAELGLHFTVSGRARALGLGLGSGSGLVYLALSPSGLTKFGRASEICIIALRKVILKSL